MTPLVGLALAIAYFAAGRLGLLLALPPGYATALFPPSGIALAATLSLGDGAWPGIWLGSLALNSSLAASTLSPKTMFLAALIATGSTLQALAGRQLVRACVGWPNALGRGRDVAGFLLAGGPLACPVSATFGCLSLLAFGVIGAESFVASWWNWWIGDVLGVTIVCPFLLLWMGQPADRWRRRRWTAGIPIASAFGLAVLVFVLVSVDQQGRIELEFGRRAGALREAFRREATAHLEAARAIGRFASASQSLTRASFHELAASLLMAHPGILSVSWHPRVERAARASFEERARRDGRPEYRITELGPRGQVQPAAARAQLWPALYVEPYAGNETEEGLDAGRIPGIAEVLDKPHPPESLIDVAAGVAPSGSGSRGSLLLLVPLPDAGSSGAAAARPGERPRGVICARLRLQDVLVTASSRLDRGGIESSILDGRVPSPAGGSEGGGLTRREDLRIAGRGCTLMFTLPADYLIAHRSWHAWRIGVGALVCTSLLGALLLVVTDRRPEEGGGLVGAREPSGRPERPEAAVPGHPGPHSGHPLRAGPALGIRLLVCESDADTAGRLYRLLAGLGCGLDVASSPTAARELAAVHRYRAGVVNLASAAAAGVSLPDALEALDGRPVLALAARAAADRSVTFGRPLGVVDWVPDPAIRARLDSSARRVLQYVAGRKLRALIVDGREEVSGVLAALLAERSDASVARTLRQGRALLEAAGFDAAFVGLETSDGSILQLAPLLRSADGQPLPIVILGPAGTPHEPLLRAADALLAEPLSEPEVLAAARAVCERLVPSPLPTASQTPLAS